MFQGGRVCRGGRGVISRTGLAWTGDGTRQGPALLGTAQSSPHRRRLGLLSPRKGPPRLPFVLVRTHPQIQQTLRWLPGHCRDRLTDSGTLHLALCKCRRRGPAWIRARRAAVSRVRVHVAPRTRPGGDRRLRCTQEAPEHSLRRTSILILVVHPSNFAIVSSPRPRLLRIRPGRAVKMSRLSFQSTKNT